MHANQKHAHSLNKAMVKASDQHIHDITGHTYNYHAAANENAKKRKEKKKTIKRESQLARLSVGVLPG